MAPKERPNTSEEIGPVKHLRRRYFEKIVKGFAFNYFRKNARRLMPSKSASAVTAKTVTPDLAF